MDCIFCKIIDKKISATLVYEDDSVLGFKDISPKAATHVLFIPKKHIDRLDDVTSENISIISELHTAALSFANLHGLRESGFKMQVNVGEGGGQEVFHLHYHLLSNKKLDL